MKKCEVKNPLLRDGLSRDKRALKALDPGYFKPDERSTADLLRLAYRYSSTLQYYNSNNKPDGDWSYFFENDLSCAAARAGGKDPSALRELFSEDVEVIKAGLAAQDNLKAALATLFSIIINMAADIDGWFVNSADGFKARIDAVQSIKGGLAFELKKTKQAWGSAFASGLVVKNTGQPSPLLRWIDPSSYPFSSQWDTDTPTGKDWSTLLASIPDTVGKIKAVCEGLVPIFEAFLNHYTRMAGRASEYLSETLEKWPAHEPHMALFLSFLELFKYSQDNLNAFTGRHLDFYYKRVLRLSEKEAVPDRVNIVFELARHADSYILKQDTLLSAGKDSTGTDVFYKVEKDTALNKAKVEELRTVYMDYSDNGRVYAAKTANSKDGAGKPFDSGEPKWKTFGVSQKKGGKYLDEGERTMAFASIGFAISSPSLVLGEGARTVKVFISVDGYAGADEDVTAFFDVYLSGEKGWIEPASKNALLKSSEKKMELTLTLDESAPPVVPCEKFPGAPFPEGLPVLKLILKNASSTDYKYFLLKDLSVASITLEIEAKGIKNLILQNDTGAISPEKPFMPFTTAPSTGSRFYVGSPEIFSKALTSLKLHIKWKDVPAPDLVSYYANLFEIKSNSDFRVKPYFLISRKWEEGADEEELFSVMETSKGELSWSVNELASFKPGRVLEGFAEFTPGMERGFVNLELVAPPQAFGHGLFRHKYVKAIIDYAKGAKTDSTEKKKKDFIKGAETDSIRIPNEPYTPQAASIAADYAAKEDILTSGHSRFFHVYPFGIKEAGKDSSLLPRFQSGEGGKKGDDTGELYIGISAINPPRNLSILFQMAEGSADPELERQEVFWSYLSANAWTPFKKTEILSDTSDGLISSGIITFAMPKDAGNDNSMLPAGLFWIRASVQGNTNAFSDSIEILAQAASAVFVDSKNAPDFLARPIPAKTIGKLRHKDPAVKSALQPFASIGGRVREREGEFYTRVSERLRHKSRGVTVWDYERLVLEKFPSVYKAKCINHSAYTPAASEFAPGSVTVIVIPNLRNKNAVNPLEPRTPAGTLKEIRDYLSGIVSPFAAEKLQVINPLYEKIKTEFEVEFLNGYDRGYYTVELGKDIVKFLSPWAFEECADMVFGGRLHRSVVLNFVEKRPYVDFVKDFRMYTIIKNADKTETIKETAEAIPSTARSVFVSNASHTIKEISGCN